MKYLLLILVLIACNPIKRHNRLVKRFPYVHVVQDVERVDTIQVIVKGVQTDTSGLITTLKDTVEGKEGKLEYKIFTFRDSFYFQGECIADTFEKRIIVRYPVYKSAEAPFDYTLIILFIAVVLGIILIRKFS